jgi:hypothetical protein
MINYNISPKNKDGDESKKKKKKKAQIFALEIIQFHLLHISSTFTYK